MSSVENSKKKEKKRIGYIFPGILWFFAVVLIPIIHFYEEFQGELVETKYLYSFYLISALLLIAANWIFLWISKKNGHDDPFTIPIVLMISGVFCAIIVYLWKKAPPHEQYYWMVMSILSSFLGVATLVKTLVKYYESIIGFRDEVKQYAEKLSDVWDIISDVWDISGQLKQEVETLQWKTELVEVWARDELSQNKVSIKVYNMDDYIINLPFLLSQNAFQGEKLQVNVENCYTDEKAIEQVLRHGGIAIADPYYVSSLLNKSPDRSKIELIILSPLIGKNPLKHLKRGKGGKMLVYDASVDSTAGRLSEVKTRLTGEESDKADVVSLEDFVRELLKIRFWEKGSKCLEDSRESKEIEGKRVEYQSVFRNLADEIDKNKEETVRDREIHWYERFIYILSFWDFAQEKEKTCMKDYFQKYEEFYLMEPEFTIVNQYILKDAGYEEVDLPEADKNIIFTSIITTKAYLKSHPLAVLKFLKAIRVGTLRTHSVLNVGSIERISREFSRNNFFGQDAHYKSAIERILSFLEKSQEKLPDIKGLYPEDVVILKESDDYYPYLIGNGEDLADYLLERFEEKDKELKEKAQFIRDGLGV